MTSIDHQILAFWAARKMSWDGYHILGFDGQKLPRDDWNKLPPPPIINGVRPDVWGYNGNQLGIGEAKTSEDIETVHTVTQLRVFTELCGAAVLGCRLYVAVPQSAINALDRVFANLRLVGIRKIVRIHVPDIFLPPRRSYDQ